MLQDSEARLLWQSFDKGKSYTWRVAGKCKDELGVIIGPSALASLFEDEEPIAFNQRLRSLAAGYLTQPRTARQTARWIVGSWGGIRRGLDAVDGWADTLARPDRHALSEFRQMPARVSSWSKLLAFLDQSNYAIYDARTAATLNLALADLGKSNRFFVPLSQNKAVQAARTRAAPPGADWHYDQYLNILGDFVRCGLAPNILVAEMTLFANSLAAIEAGGSSLA